MTAAASCHPDRRTAELLSSAGGRPQWTIIFRVTQTMGRVPVFVRARFYDGLADPARLALLEVLRRGEKTAGDIALAAHLSPSNTSKHLACYVTVDSLSLDRTGDTSTNAWRPEWASCSTPTTSSSSE